MTGSAGVQERSALWHEEKTLVSSDDLITLLARVPPQVKLYPVAQVVLKRLLSAQSVELVEGGTHSAEHYRQIYRQRRDRLLQEGLELPFGLLETVYKLEQAEGTVSGGYARIDDALVYFFVNESGQLIGCVGN